MTSAILILATLLHRSVALVTLVYNVAGIDGISVVWMESNFISTAKRNEPRGHTSYGLWQIDDEWNPQYRGDLVAHVIAGAALLLDYERAAGGDFALAVAHYNGGIHPQAYSIAWGKTVEAKRDALACYVWQVTHEELSWLNLR